MKNTEKLRTLTALAILLPGLCRAVTMTPLPVTGWNQDMIINNGSPSYDQSITGTVDNGAGNIEGGTFGEAGTYPVQPSGTATAVNGLVAGMVYTSLSSSGTTFQFQDFSSSNSLLLTSSQSGTLSLVTPATMTSLALIGTSGNGNTSASVVLTFADSTTSTYSIPTKTGITSDWFKSGTNTVALAIGTRVSNHHEDNFATIFFENNSTISIYESDIALTAADQAKKVSSIMITNTATSGTLAIMAVSSDAAGTTPPVALKITSYSFDFSANTVTLNFTSNSGTTYKATHSATLSGTDWNAIAGATVTANGPTSSLIVPFSKGTKDFFRIETGS